MDTKKEQKPLFVCNLSLLAAVPKLWQMRNKLHQTLLESTVNLFSSEFGGGRAVKISRPWAVCGETPEDGCGIFMVCCEGGKKTKSQLLIS